MEYVSRLVWPNGEATKWAQATTVAEYDASPDPEWNNREAAVALEALLSALLPGTVVTIGGSSVIEYRRVV